MPTTLKFLPFFIAIACIFSSCNKEEAPSATINRLDLTIADSTAQLSPDQQQAIDAWLAIKGDKFTLANYRKCTPVKVFSPIIKESLPPLDSVERVIGYALNQLGDTTLRLYGIVIPNTQSIITIPNGIVLIGLNHYLGRSHKIYRQFPMFLRRRKELARMPVDITQALLAAKYPAKMPDTPTLLNVMLYEGALLEATRQALPPETSEALLLGMSEDEYDWCVKQEQRIWNALINENLLFSSSEHDIRNLTTPAMRSSQISGNAPGLTALYIGMKIAQSYLRNNPDKEVTDLLSPEYYSTNPLVDSNYNPAANAD